MAVASAQRGEAHSEINVTPLVDVCLVLLIIFMVVGPQLQPFGVDVMLAQGEHPAAMAPDPSQLVVGIKADKGLWLDKTFLAEAELRSALQEAWRRSPGRELVVKADARLEYRDVRRVMRLVKECGFQNIGLVAARRQK